MKNINKIAFITTKTIEIVEWISAGFYIMIALLTAFAPNILISLITGIIYGPGVQIEYHEWDVINLLGISNYSLILLCISGVIATILKALIFHKLSTIFKNSKDSTPFQAKNVSLLKHIGFLSIATPFIACFTKFIFSIFAHEQNINFNFNLDGILMGIIIFTLTQYFIHGVELEQSMDGLV